MPMTLNETQMEMLKSFVASDMSYKKAEAAQEACSPTLAPFEIHELNKAFYAAFSVRISMALGLAMCLADTFVAEQGPRDNPEGTAGDAGTPA